MKRWIVCTSLVILGVALYWHWRVPDPAELRADRKSAAERLPGREITVADVQALPDRSPAAGMVDAIYGHPIAFWGRVVDETGAPIESVEVEFSAASRFASSPSSSSTTSDGDGRFSIEGIHGSTLHVELRKAGYYRVANQSYATIAYGHAGDPTSTRPPPTRNQPAQFVLQKVKVAPSIHQARGWQIVVPQDGTPIAIHLSDGRHTVGDADGDVVVQTYVDPGKMLGNRYAWSCVIRVPHGGVQPRKNATDFDAPEAGYAGVDEIRMPLPVQPASRWTDRVSRDYFVKLGDGRFGRVKLQIYSDRLPDKNWICFESVVGPAGERHLEAGANGIGNPK